MVEQTVPNGLLTLVVSGIRSADVMENEAPQWVRSSPLWTFLAAFASVIAVSAAAVLAASATPEIGYRAGVAALMAAILAVPLAFLAIASNKTGKALQAKRFVRWKEAFSNVRAPDLDRGVRQRTLLEWLFQYPGASDPFWHDGRQWSRENEVRPGIVAMAKELAVSDGNLDIGFVEAFLAAMLAISGRMSEGKAKTICEDFLEELSEWIVSDPMNWRWGTGMRDMLGKPEFSSLASNVQLFSDMANSVFPPKDFGDFSLALAIFSDFLGEGSLGEDLGAKTFFSLLVHAPFGLPIPAAARVRFRRLFDVSMGYWDDERKQKAVELCLSGSFGPELAKFAVPYVAHLDWTSADPLDFDEEAETELSYRLEWMSLSWVHPAARSGVEIVLHDIGHPNTPEGPVVDRRDLRQA